MPNAVVLESHEISQIAANLQDAGVVDEHASTEDIAQAVSSLVQEVLDNLNDPSELMRVVGRYRLNSELSRNPQRFCA